MFALFNGLRARDVLEADGSRRPHDIKLRCAVFNARVHDILNKPMCLAHPSLFHWWFISSLIFKPSLAGRFCASCWSSRWTKFRSDSWNCYCLVILLSNCFLTFLTCFCTKRNRGGTQV